MSLPTNILQQVQTYQKSSLGYMQNLCCFVSTANTKFKNFENETANLGSSITFDLPPRYTTQQGLVASFQPSVQQVHTLTASQSANTSYAFDESQFIFNVRDYMEEFGKNAMQELATAVEIDVAKNANSSVRNQLTGALQTNSGPFRFFGDGRTPINSYNQLAQALMLFKNFGSVREGIKVYLPDTAVPAIVGTGLNQFAPERNNKIAMSWEVGEFGTPPVKFYQSNLLPTHTAGTIGDEGTTLTLVSTNDPTGAEVTELTFSGAGTDADAIKAGDLIEFNDGVSGQPNMRYLTWIGHATSANTVQVRATANAASSGGNVTISIYPALRWQAGAEQNLNNALAAGMQVSVLPSRKCGLIVGGNALYVAMPKLSNQRPYDTYSKADPTTGVALRMYFGSLFGQNQQGFVNDIIWGSTLVPRYCMQLAFPLT